MTWPDQEPDSEGEACCFAGVFSGQNGKEALHPRELSSGVSKPPRLSVTAMERWKM